MEYINTVQPLLSIFISLSIGLFFGAFWMFCLMAKHENKLTKELDSKSKLLDTYINIYENDDYEAY